MHSAVVLVLEPDQETRQVVQQALADLQLRPVVSGSWGDASREAERRTLDLVIADWRAMVDDEPAPGDGLVLTNRLRCAMSHLRSHQHRADRPGGRRPLGFVVTSGPRATPMHDLIHAAAIAAGAEAYLVAEDLRDPRILESYLTRFLEQTALLAQRESMDTVAWRAVAPSPRHVAEVFDLPIADLRDDTTGRWDAARIAAALGIELRVLVHAIGARYGTVHKTPHSEAVQPALAPFGNVLAMVRQVYGGDDRRVRKWLNQPQQALGGLSPLHALRQPGQAMIVEQWVAGLWTGDGG